MIILGIAGAMRRMEIWSLELADVQDNSDHLSVSVKDTKTRVDRSFIIITDTEIPYATYVHQTIHGTPTTEPRRCSLSMCI